MEDRITSHLPPSMHIQLLCTVNVERTNHQTKSLLVCQSKQQEYNTKLSESPSRKTPKIKIQKRLKKSDKGINTPSKERTRPSETPHKSFESTQRI